ncbi:c-type cytochrome [Methylobacillus flagellatus]|uniref:di-heme oxidoreductase family protein n=1 Tax=Methylobacillus flagellatus TaxID=405 RepID=UPI002853EE39|nr:di-heme oxidoredictase family protein [Methylobacillus flagellatus]MDR5172610.1 c-type cytochrome [Methylobacillus flagellatus]
MHGILSLTVVLVTLFAIQASGNEPAQVMTNVANREAYTQAVSPLSTEERQQFLQGRSLVRQSWIISPAMDNDIAGLGPLYNRNACIACHAKNGRGFAPNAPEESMRAMLVRLSLPGKTHTGAPVPHPAYGDQLQEFGAPGVKAEGRAHLHYEETEVTLDGGEAVRLRKPILEFSGLAYGPLPANIQTSARIAPAIHGMGLLEAIADDTLLALQAMPKPGKIKGRVNRVWSVEKQQQVIGRFGWKANVATVREQTASALAGDMGLSSHLFPHGNCAECQTGCRQAPVSGRPEIPATQLAQMEFYQLALAVPSPRRQDDPRVQRGAALFRQAQCAACHLPEIRTGEFPRLAALGNQAIAPYTDLLLHDMGPELADHRPDFAASGREWRTPPLWGIGLAKQVEPNAGFLHDGRARSILEAILWHGGEAQESRAMVQQMSPQERQWLLDFIESL